MRLDRVHRLLARLLERAREIAPDDHGEVSEQRGAAGGDIKDDGLHRSPFLGSAL
jgi:hypothetical protein